MTWSEIAKALTILLGVFAIVALFIVTLTWAIPS
jgi:hypothetical protein